MSTGIDQAVQTVGQGLESEPTTGQTENGNNGTMLEEFVDIHVAQHRVNRSTVAQQSQGAEPPPEAVTEQLRQRIRELEAVVQSQNEDLIRNQIDKRNYEATLERLARVKTEKEVIEENREKLLTEKLFFQQQAEGYIKDIDGYRERLEDCNRQLLSARNDTDEKIKGLEKAACFWKEKYENEKGSMTENRAQYSGSLQAISCDHGGQKPEGIRSLDSPRQSKRRRHTFHQSPTVLPKCKNCSTVFDRLKPHEVQCRFHRSGPQPWKIWKKQLCEVNQKFDHVNTQGYMYWPCCGHVGLKEPPGCLKLKGHDLSSPGEE
ncbi:uncharacterized protein LOC123525461 [Mercenaria mercenaria]|uniref:uncharacterized protein LOC123525461 n=1 Tax=Mercenaria mercenaria TaxID=6596 RepID=UPI00234E7EDD|nr:uncharacterized protein LOC123525461 [Mercenaria mercenaria]